MKRIFIRIGAAIVFVAVMVMNFLANALPIGGITTGEASDRYPNLFTPAGATFSIWGLIYFLLAIYTIYQLGWLKKDSDEKHASLLDKIGIYYIVTSFANIAWIFAWHNNVIWLSVVIMLGLLFGLIKIANILRKEQLSKTQNICIRVPFSIYFGWITVATIANITILLVSIGWGGWGMPHTAWTVLILLVGALIGIVRAMYDRNVLYIAVFVWAYSGILFKHISSSGFDSAYPAVIATAILCVVAFLVTGGLLMQKRQKTEEAIIPKNKQAIVALMIFIAAGVASLFLTQSVTQTSLENEQAFEFYCEDEKSIQVRFVDRDALLWLSDGRHIVVGQAISASGARFADEDESFVFWTKGNGAFIEEFGVTTFENCILSGTEDF